MTRETRWSARGWSQVLIVALFIAVFAPLAAGADEAPALRSRRVEYPAPVEGPVSEPHAKVQSAVPESGATLYVGPTQTYTTIQAAVIAASPGDTIVVEAGTYVEGYPIGTPTQNLLVDKTLTLLGPNAGKAWNDPTRVAEAIVRPVIDDPDGNIPVVAVTASNVRIDGFTIDGNNSTLPPLVTDQLVGGLPIHAGVGIQNGVYNYANPPMYDLVNIVGTTIDNNILRNNSYAGIYLWDTYGVNNPGNNIRHNSFDNMFEGIQVYAMLADISSNAFTGVSRALSMHQVNTGDPGGFVPRIADNTLTAEDTAGYSRDNGFWINGWHSPAPPLLVSGNTVNVPAGLTAGMQYRGFQVMYVTGTASVTFANNTVNGNNRCDVGLLAFNIPSTDSVSWTGGQLNGITSDGVLVVTTDSAWGTGDTYLSVDSLPVTLTSTANGARVYVDPANPSYVASLELNSSSVSGGATGVLVSGANASATVHLSRITGNTTGASAAFGTIDATNNWWGCNAGPGGTGCDSVSGSGVTYSPWLILSLSAIPTTVPASGGTAALDANIFTNSVPANLFGTGAFPSAGSVAFGATAPHSASPTPLTLSGGAASSTFTAGATQGSTLVTATLDGQTVSTSVIVGNPLPSITSLSPTTEPAGTAGPVILTVTGTGFTSGSVISWNGTPVGTFFNSATEIYTLLVTANLAAAGNYPVTVTNPAPAGGISNAVDFVVSNPQPVLTSMMPAAIATGSADFTLTLTGSGFVSGATAYWDGAILTTTYVSAIKLTAAVPAANVAAVGSHTVQVQNPTPNLGDSATLTFQVSTPTDVYVDDNYVGLALGTSVDWPYTGSGLHSIGLDAFATIQAGVNAVGVAGTVHVAAGMYAEQVLISKALSLLGPNAGKAGYDPTRAAEALLVPPSILNASSSPREWNWDAVLEIAASQVTVNGMAVSCDNPALDGYHYAGMNIECGIAAYSEGNQVTFQNNIVTKATVIGFWAGGLQTVSYTGLVLADNLVEGIQDLNQLGYGFGMYVQATAGTVSGNRVTNCRNGMQIQPYRVVGAPTLVTGNAVSSWRTGIYYNYAEEGASAWTITGNTVSACTAPAVPAGLVAWDGIKAETMRSTGNGGTISNNTVNGLAALTDPAHTGWGGFHQAVWGLHYAGSASNSTQVFFTSNTVTNVEFGMVHDAPADIVFTGNSLSTTAPPTGSEQAIVLQRSYSSAGIQQSYGGTGNIDATGGNTINGVATGTATPSQLFAIEDAIRHKVDDATLGLVRVRPLNLFVTPSSFSAPNTTTPSIQRAIDAATAGDTVNVEAGTYAENLVVNKALTLSGPNAGKTGWATRDPEALLLPSTVGPYIGAPDYSTTILRATASDVTVRGFAFDGNNPNLAGNPREVEIDGVMVHASTGISNYADDHGYAVPVSGVTLENSRFAHFGYCGIDLEGNGTTPTVDSLIQNNYFTSLDPGDTPVYGWGVGIVLAENGYADVLNNRGANVRKGVQTNNFYRANTGTTASIKDNDFETWRYGLYHNLHYSDASPFTISGNTFRAAAGSTTNRGLGLSSMQGGVGAVIQNNTVIGGFAGLEAWNIPVTVPITIEGGSATGCQFGLLLWNNQVPGYGSSSGTSLLNVTGTSLLNSTVAGIRVFDDPANTEPLCNMILTATGLTATGDVVGIKVENSRASATITNSDLSGNTSYGANNLGGTLTATCDWWGDATGPVSAANPGATAINSPASANVTYSPWAGTNTFNCSLAYGLPARLVFTTQPSNDTAGAAITPTVTVRAEDASGNLAYSFNATVTLTLGGGTAGAIATGNSVAAVNGVATFPALSVDRGGTAYTFTASATYGTVPVSSNPSSNFDIDNPVPTLLSMSPTWVRVDAATPVTLSLTGTNFVPTSTVYWGATALVTTYVDGTHLKADAPAPLAVGSVNITVVNGPPPATNTSNPLPFEVLPIPMTVWVDQAWTGHASGDLVGGHLFGYDAFAVIQDGVNAVGTTGTVNVATGTYLAEVTVNRAMLLHGAGVDQVTLMGRKNDGGQNTLIIGASGVTVEGLTVTRDGNNPTDWGSNVKSQGVIFSQGVTASTLQFCKVTGNRKGVYLNNAQGNTIKNNVIDFNRTGIHLVNDVTGTVIRENAITNNWTLGLIFNTVFPAETSATSALTVADNNVSGNWYTQVECRWILSTATLDVSGNWLGSSALLVRNTDAGEPSYTAQIPIEYGGTAVNPGGAYSVGGVHSDRVDYTPWLNTGTDTAPGIIGFQGDFSYLNVGAASPQWGATPRIAEAIGLVTPAGTVNLTAGTFTENVVVNKPLTLMGAGELLTTIVPALSAPNTCSGASLCPGASNIILVQANNVTVQNMTLDGDNPLLTSGIVRGGADLDARNGIITDHTTGTYANLEVHHCTVKNIYLRGMYASTSSTFNFHHDTVTNVRGDGGSIGMFAWGGPGSMADNTVSLCNDAISANHSKGIQFLRNTVTNSSSGIHTDNSGDGGGVADLIQGNTVTDSTSGGYGIWTFVPYLAPIVEDNTITNCDVGLSAWGQGAPVTHVYRNNIVTGSGSVGAYITTDLISWGYRDVSVDFQNNTITGFGTAVYFTADPQSWNPDPWSSQTIHASFFNNTIQGNTAGMDKGTQGSYDLTARCNYWGSATGPHNATLNPSGTGNSVSDGVTFVPWSTVGAPDYTCDGYVPPTLNSADLAGPYTVGVSREFHVSVDNPALGNTYSHVRFNFTISGTVLADIAAFEYFDGATWRPLPITQSGPDVTGYYGPVGGFPMPAPYSATSTFRITMNTARTYPVTIQLVNLDAGSAVLASLTATALANPGTPVITGITDNSPCAQDGIYITYTPGAGAASHTLVVDGTTLVPNYASGALYNPGDTATHTYLIRAVGGASTTDSAGSSFADVNDTPTAVTNVVVDNPDCTGARITFTSSPTALGYELWVDGTLEVTGFTSGGRYTPADGASHSYVVRAVRNTCFTDSAPVAYAVVNLTPPRVTDSLMVTKSGNNMLLSWDLILPASVVDYYQVGRFIPQPSGPPVFETVIGTASGQVNGIQVSLTGEPANAMYLVRAVKGSCYGPWE